MRAVIGSCAALLTALVLAALEGSTLIVGVCLFCFIQNVSFTFVSRGRNSGSLGYHMIAAVFSNGIYAVLLFTSIDIIANAKEATWLFLTCYTLSTMSGSVFAHWLALRVERGKARNVQEDRVSLIEKTIVDMQSSLDKLAGRLAVTESPTRQAVTQMDLDNVAHNFRVANDNLKRLTRRVRNLEEAVRATPPDRLHKLREKLREIQEELESGEV